VWEGVMLDSLTPKQKKCIITSSMFGKAKYTADGILINLSLELLLVVIYKVEIYMIMAYRLLLVLLVYSLLQLLLLRKIVRSLQSTSLVHF
jgi:hypothetical protein